MLLDIVAPYHLLKVVFRFPGFALLSLSPIIWSCDPPVFRLLIMLMTQSHEKPTLQPLSNFRDIVEHETLDDRHCHWALLPLQYTTLIHLLPQHLQKIFADQLQRPVILSRNKSACQLLKPIGVQP